MTNEPDQIRAEISAVLAQLPFFNQGDDDRADRDLDETARSLAEAHDVLVRALETVEKG